MTCIRPMNFHSNRHSFSLHIEFSKKKKSSFRNPFVTHCYVFVGVRGGLTGGPHVTGSQQVTQRLVNKWIIRVHKIVIELCHEIASRSFIIPRIYSRHKLMVPCPLVRRMPVVFFKHTVILYHLLGRFNQGKRVVRAR